MIAAIGGPRLIAAAALYRVGIGVAGARPRHAAAARRARLRAALLAGRAHAGRLARHVAVVARDRLRAPARDARLHRARDGREPRRGDAAARRRTCRGASSPGSAPSSPSTSRSRSSASRPSRRRTARPSSATRGCGAPLMGIVAALDRHLPDWLRRRCASTSASRARSSCCSRPRRRSPASARLAYSLGEHGQLPRAFGRLHRRTLVSPQAIVLAAVVSSALIIATSFVARATSRSSRASSASASCSRSPRRSSP